MTIENGRRSVFRPAALQHYLTRREAPVLPALRRLGRTRRVPVVRQPSPLDCGPACLAMVLGYHGRPTPIAECRTVCGVGRDGASAQALAQAARHYGLRVKALSIEPAEFARLPLPAIAHWDFRHFVVVERWSPRKVDIVDPGVGRLELSAREFSEHFTGVVLALEPGAHFEPRRRSEPPTWRGLARRLSGLPELRRGLVLILAASALLQALGLGVPLATKLVVDEVLRRPDPDRVTLIGAGMVVVMLALLATAFVRARLLVHLEARLDTHLMLGFFEHVLALPYAFFQERPSGDLIMRLGSNQLLRETLTNQTVSALLDGSLVVVYLALLIAWQPAFGGLVLALGLMQVALLVVSRRQSRALLQRDLCATAESQSYLVEALAGIATLKAAGAEDRALDHWSNLFYKQLNLSLERRRIGTYVDSLLFVLRLVSPLLLLWIGAGWVVSGTLELGSLFGLCALAGAVLVPLAALTASVQQLDLAGAHVERIVDVTEAAAEQDRSAVRPAPRLTGRISLAQVDFRYSPNAPLVLQDISLVIEPGQKLAIVGRSGSGKSTLARLLLGLHSPTAGEIRFDGIPLQQLDFRSVRRQFGVVLQESYLFSGSIRQNIAFNCPELSLEKIVAAARRAQIDTDIQAMPMGYETLLTESGGGLSGGQRQRLALARALAHQPAVLLLDEATSHLDVVTEQRLDASLASLSCTRIVVAHRLSTIRNADTIVVLDQGRIAEQGSHDDLMSRAGLYAALVRCQGETVA